MKSLKVRTQADKLNKCKFSFCYIWGLIIRSDKLIDIKKRMDEITKLPRHEWTQADAEFMEIALDPKVFSLLQNIKN